MPCYHPLKGWRTKNKNPSGKRGITFKLAEAYLDMPISVPCGQCIGCRLEKSRQWAIRCMHEASLYENNCFITLTYDDAKLPYDYGLCLDHFQKFMKKLRKKYGNGIRFFHCGEYGEQFSRPHYHAILFNHDFLDRELHSTSNGINLYTSKSLQSLWEHGFTTVGDCTFDSAAYVARYITKKVTGDQAEEHYQIVNPETGEVFDRKPEYVTMSRRPGIAKNWYEKYKTDVYPHDYVVVNGKEVKPPKYYDSIYETQNPIDFRKLKYKREISALEHADNNSYERLSIREKVKKSQISTITRKLEKEL